VALLRRVERLKTIQGPGPGPDCCRSLPEAAREPATLFRVHVLKSVLNVGKLLIEFAEARLQVGDIVGESCTCVPMVSRRAPEVADKSWVFFWTAAMLVLSLLTESIDCSIRVR